MHQTLNKIGPDILLNELSENIEEIVKSYEVEDGGKLIPIKPIDNLGDSKVTQLSLLSSGQKK